MGKRLVTVDASAEGGPNTTTIAIVKTMDNTRGRHWTGFMGGVGSVEEKHDEYYRLQPGIWCTQYVYEATPRGGGGRATLLSLLLYNI